MPESPRRTPPPVLYIPRPSTWLMWHARWFAPGKRVLDIASGEGRHALMAAQWGASVVALENDEDKLETAREAASRLGVEVDFKAVDLEGPWPELGAFDAVLVFNYLDRSRMGFIRELVAPGGVLLMETYLEGQREQGWGPTSPAYLLKPGELATLVAPLEIIHGREVIEPLESARLRIVASVIAQRR
ncbi:MAG: class I SAM-dependent methyltransferase [Gemmatimonadota bacterium]